MNERIGQLAQEAGKYAAVMSAHAKFYDSIASTSVDTRSTNEMFIEKFAELIVKECARVASETVIECEGIDFDLVRECYEHFGIEP